MPTISGIHVPGIPAMVLDNPRRISFTSSMRTAISTTATTITITLVWSAARE